MGLLALVGRWLRGHDRNIFEFWDGSRTLFGRKSVRRIDPLQAYKATFDFPGFSWERTLSEIDMKPIGDNPGDLEFQLRGKLAALATCAACVRSVFGIKPLSQGGLTDEECYRLILDFEQFVLGVKKNGSGRQSLPQSAESTPTPATKNDLESGSTAIDVEPLQPSGPPKESLGDSLERSA